MSNVRRKICKQKTRTSLDTINQTEPYGQLLGNHSDSPLQCWEQEYMQQIVQPGYFKPTLPLLKGPVQQLLLMGRAAKLNYCLFLKSSD